MFSFILAAASAMASDCEAPVSLTPKLFAPVCTSQTSELQTGCRTQQTDGSWVRPGTTDAAVHEENAPEYPPLATALMTVRASIDYVLDAGANDGYSSWLFAQALPNATIVAVEPSPSNYAMVLANMQGRSNIVPLLAGLWDEPTKIDIGDTGHGEWALVTHASKNASTGDNQVYGVTVPSIMESLCIAMWDLVKMDIEGAEAHAMAGTQGQEWLRKTRFFYAEVHPNMEYESLRVALQAMFDADMQVFTFPLLEHPALRGRREYIYFACGRIVGRDVCASTCTAWRGASGLSEHACSLVEPGEQSILAEYANSAVPSSKVAPKQEVSGALEPVDEPTE